LGQQRFLLLRELQRLTILLLLEEVAVAVVTLVVAAVVAHWKGTLT
jgi:hypothetical protein